MRDTTLSLVIDDYRPGALAAIVGLHMAYYAPAWGFSLPFETKVAGELAAFLARRDPRRDLFLCAWDAEGRLAGSITMDGLHAQGEGAHLRWFIVADHARGTGLGRRLVTTAMQFCHEKGYRRAFLTTFAGLDAARHLYESVGFVLAEERGADPWGGRVGEQRFVWRAGPAA